MLAQLMQGQGQVVALDRSHAKVDDIRALAEELGCAGCMQAYKMDATKAVAKQRANDSAGAEQEQQQENGQQQQQGHQQQQQQWQAADSRLQQQPPPQQQQQQLPPSTAGLSAKAQARLQRRIAAMAARGQAPPAAEYRWVKYAALIISSELRHVTHALPSFV
jgi:hypothetical protein